MEVRVGDEGVGCQVGSEAVRLDISQRVQVVGCRVYGVGCRVQGREPLKQSC